jgi:aryl-phospho-beta-D-glucosidase BglC (GH1 family)
VDSIAQDAFVFLWETFAQRYHSVPNQQISFDLLNEPPNVGQYGMTRENHAAVMRRATAAIRAVHPERQITIDGIGGGGIAVPELADLSVIHSGRGYAPMAVSHYQAAWWDGHHGLPEPVYPGTQWDGKTWNRETLKEYYRPWREVQAQGVPVHIGEMGCYNQTPNDVALRWFADLLGLFKEFGWGYSLWGFEGAFGIINHGRPGAHPEPMQGYEVDRALFDLLLNNRV